GVSRRESFEKLAEILRCMEVRGHDLHLNVDFHYGLLHWLLGNDPMLKPNTRFVSAYLALAGKIKRICDQVNLEVAWKIQLENIQKKYGREGLIISEQKLTLILRPLKKLFSRTHLLMGWLALQKSKNTGNNPSARQNPVLILKNLYHFLRLDQHSGIPPSEQIWVNDQQILENAVDFYSDFAHNFGQSDISWAELTVLLNSKKAPKTFLQDEDPQFWERILASHKGHQVALELLRLPEIIAEKAGYYEFLGNEKLEVEIPPEFSDPELAEGFTAGLAPQPPASGNEILAWTGGTFYSRETPEAEEYVREGQHIEEGDVLGLLEVMKMFNQIRAEFPGTIRKICVEAGSGIKVSRGQSLFLLDPDVPPVTETEEEIFKKQQEQTTSIMQNIYPAN
ncbi:MAG: biotin/lipoyl-containing protein, partial [SAR324 cluster bacterium]|nr:biotin/lipoyl-containing protein [SAR324 cluster bacterium]